VESALREALFGNFGASTKGSEGSEHIINRPRRTGLGALALALSGERLEAQRLTEDLDQQFPDSTCVRPQTG
jgi:hypothetical protein